MEGGPSILIVDDEAAVTMALEGFFRNKGYHVLRAFYGDQAVEKIEQDKPALVILDLQMPGVDGISVVRKNEAGRSAPLSSRVRQEGHCMAR